MTWIKGPLATSMPRLAMTAQARTALERHEVEHLLHVRFYNEEPDLRIPTPAVPG